MICSPSPAETPLIPQLPNPVLCNRRAEKKTERRCCLHWVIIFPILNFAQLLSGLTGRSMRIPEIFTLPQLSQGDEAETRSPESPSAC